MKRRLIYALSVTSLPSLVRVTLVLHFGHLKLPLTSLNVFPQCGQFILSARDKSICAQIKAPKKKTAIITRKIIIGHRLLSISHILPRYRPSFNCIFSASNPASSNFVSRFKLIPACFRNAAVNLRKSSSFMCSAVSTDKAVNQSSASTRFFASNTSNKSVM